MAKRMTTYELERHIGTVLTDAAQSMEELTELYEEARFNGTTRVCDIDGNVLSIDTQIAWLQTMSEKLRDYEKKFKYV